MLSTIKQMLSLSLFEKLLCWTEIDWNKAKDNQKNPIKVSKRVNHLIPKLVEAEELDKVLPGKLRSQGSPD